MTHTLHRYLTGEALRPATFDERRRYREATLNSGVGLGDVLVDDGLPCYVEDGSGYADPACTEQAWEAYHDACASWGETAAEVGASHFMATRNACDANLVGARAAGPLPRLEDYGVTRSPPPPPPPVDHDDDDEIPF
jgi:hypothetical protein